MHLAQQVLGVEGVEVAADRHLGHVEIGGEVGDPDGAAGVQRPQDRLASFGGEHLHPRSQPLSPWASAESHNIKQIARFLLILAPRGC